ncbi:hypothetical protein [Mycobacterium riyadhense]|nr:hypothetical protein [Mycobacterium riyadhense]
MRSPALPAWWGNDSPTGEAGHDEFRVLPPEINSARMFLVPDRGRY